MAPKKPSEHKGLLQTHDLYNYIMETNVYPREPAPLKEIRALSASHPWALMVTTPDAGQMLAILLKLLGAKKTIEIGVFTGYSLLLTALTIPDDGKIDVDREAYEIGRPVIEKAEVDHKIDFVESEGLPALDKMLENMNYINYHKRIMKLVKVNGIVVYDNTLWFGTVAQPEASIREELKEGRASTIKFNKSLASDPRVEISLVPLGDGLTIC